MAKRARTSTSEMVVIIEDDPTATAGDAPETTLPGSESSVRRSPQRSPQRKYSDYFPLAGAGEYIFVADISGRVGEEQQVEPPEGVPEVLPPSTTPPRRESPARDPTDELSHDEEPARTEAPSAGAGGPSPTIDVAEGGEPTIPESDTGKPTCHRTLLLPSLSLFFVLLNFSLKLFLIYFLGWQILPRQSP
jgi:hypothetical protein